VFPICEPRFTRTAANLSFTVKVREPDFVGKQRHPLKSGNAVMPAVGIKQGGRPSLPALVSFSYLAAADSKSATPQTSFALCLG